MLEQKRKRFDQELRRLTLAAASTFGHCYPSVLVAYGDLDDGAARLASANPDNERWPNPCRSVGASKELTALMGALAEGLRGPRVDKRTDKEEDCDRGMSP